MRLEFPVPVARAVAALELPILAAVAPALLFPTSLRLLGVLVVLPVFWAQRQLGRPFVPATTLNPALWVLLIMAGVTLLVTPAVSVSLEKVCALALGVWLFWALTRWLGTETRLRIAAVGFAVAGAGLAVIGLTGTNWVPKFPALIPVTDTLPVLFRGVHGAPDGFNPNAVAGCLVLFIGVQLVLVLPGGLAWLTERIHSPSRRRLATWGLAVPLWCSVLLTLGTLVLLQSLNALVAIIVTAAAFLVWFRPWTRLMLALVVVVAGLTIVNRGPVAWFDTTFSRSGGTGVSSLAIRAQIWRSGLEAFTDAPVTGLGLNVFRTVAPERYPAAVVGPGGQVAHTHNHVLQAAVDLGLPGLVAYLVIWWHTATGLITAYRHTTRRVYRALAGGVGAGLIAHFMFGMADAIPLGTKAGVTFWITLALAGGVTQRLRHASPPTAPPPEA
jgi:putative inorganic carbon (hco3(-)) transporter